jgi:PAS domain S-box-containing protein
MKPDSQSQSADPLLEPVSSAQGEEFFSRTLAIQNVLFESVAEAILVVNRDWKIVSYNRKFLELWQVPETVLKESNDAKHLLGYCLGQLKDPEGFLERVKETYERPELVYYDIFEFRDGRIADRYSHPYYRGGQCIGKVVSFRDITERIRTEESLRTALSLHQATIESTTDGILVVDCTGRIVSFNQKFVQMWRIPESVIDSRDDNQALTFALEQLKDPVGFLSKVRELYAQRDAESFDILEFKDGRIFERHSLPQKIAGQTVGRVWSFRDVTERKRGDEALRASEERLRQAIRVADIGLFDHDHRTDAVYWSPVLWKIFGWGPGEVASLQAFLASVYPEDLERVGAEVRRAHDPAGNGIYDVEHRIVRRDGEIRWISTRSQTFFEHIGAVRRPLRTIGAVVDITERKQAEQIQRVAYDELEMRVEERTAELSKANTTLLEQVAVRQRAEDALKHTLGRLQQLSQHVLQIQEDKYKFISRELHDNIAQSLNAVKMRLERLELGMRPTFTEHDQEIREAVSQLREISQTVRDLSKQMRPEILDELGLLATLEAYIKDFQKRTGLQTGFIYTTINKVLVPDLETHLYRIVQEALSNAAKHARASYAVVRIKMIKQDLILAIEDNGIGFALEKLVGDKKHPLGMGLISIQERANLLKGIAEIKSKPGSGTKVIVRVPVS